MTNFNIIIGLEIHAELSTRSKMFCPCQNDPFKAEPNQHICPVCFGLPGALPVPNREAIRRTYLVGRALGATLNKIAKFDRKNYFYPDLPKGYQISQYDQPIASGGSLPVGERDIKITRLHLEEDTGKLSHTGTDGGSLVDYNRSGVPLMELVTDPVISSAVEAKAFCERYQLLLRYLSVANAEMEKGEMRCEANISVQLPGSYKVVGSEVVAEPGQRLNPKVEIKNLNSFRSVEKSIEYEVKRQIAAIQAGEKLAQETRGWDEAKQKTVHQRGKESAHDYRYFPEPDIPELEAAKFLADTKLPELPWQKEARYISMGLTADQARLVASNIERADYFDQASTKGPAKTIANIFLNRLGGKIALPAGTLGGLAAALETGKFTSAALPHVLADLEGGKALEEISQTAEGNGFDLSSIVSRVLKEHPTEVAAYKAGRTQVTNVFLGAIMKETRGGANTKEACREIEQRLNNTGSSS